MNCPKCQGKVLLSDEDAQGIYGHCQECGYNWQVNDGQSTRLAFEDAAERMG